MPCIGTRVLFVNRMASMERGGGETFDIEISVCLAGMECQITFLSGLPLFGRARTPIRRHSHTPTLRSPSFRWLPWDRMRGGWRLRLADFWMFEQLAAAWVLRHQDEFDVVQVCELPFFVNTVKRRGAKPPVVLRLTAPNYFDPHGALLKADALIASGVTVEQVRAKVRPDCEDVPNAVDSDAFRPHASPFRGEAGIGPDEFVVLYVARFQAFKNHELLLDAFRRLLDSRPASRLVLVGGGPLERRARQQAAALGMAERVMFLGEVPFERLPDIYAAADVKAISSDFESFCFAALEAMATALPIVTTDCGWVPQLIGRDGGQIVPCRDVIALAAALAELAGDPGLRRRMGEVNRRKAVAEHGWKASADKLLNVYERVLDGRRS